MRKVRENFIVGGNGVAVVAGDNYIYSLDGELEGLNGIINTNDLVFYDVRTGLTVTAGDTSVDIPKLGIGQAVDPQGLGYPTTIRNVYGGYIDSCALENVTTEPPNCGCNQIQDFFTKCTFEGDTYAITIETRGDKELDYNLWNQWTKETFSVNIKDFTTDCENCDTTIDCTAVMCALSGKINAHEKTYSAKQNGPFLKRALNQQVKKRSFVAYPIYAFDKTYDIVHADTACEDCVHITGIGGIDIAGTQYIFSNTTIAGGVLSLKGQQDRIVNLINKAFRDEGVEGHAVLKQQIKGTGAPCCDFQILINSCVTFDLEDGNQATIVQAAVNPFTAITVDPHCKGCVPGSSWTPTCGLRVVALGLNIDCDCNNPVDRKAWYHNEVRISVPTDNNYQTYVTSVVQATVIPDGLGVQWKKRMLDADNGGKGRDYDGWTVDKTGIYSVDRKGTAFTDAFANLVCQNTYCSIIFTHGLKAASISTTGSPTVAKGRSILLLDNADGALFTAVAAILDPWLATVTCGNFGPVDCTADTDQNEHVTWATGVASGTGSFDKFS